MSEVTTDGRPVDLYAVLPATGEPAFVHARVPPGAAILDLSGCGGRFADPLAGLGHPVVVADDSAAILAQVRDARTVHAALETLDLGERFPVVLVASTRVNTADLAVRTALLEACRRHVAPDGRVVMHWLPPSWFDKATSYTGRTWQIEVTFEIESFDGTVLHSHGTYRLDGASWEQRASVRRLSRADLHAALAAAGLRFERHLGGGRQFFAAVPLTAPPGA
ncbi:class I SAM-dependent methyltransferase [Dactylosporangium sp. NBC_01737]|uniref:class I SAM-dependent methyltransferase n=1 Tax=Dactylosporangium sp. NBC_01737 TaxID=2975959 RepID=UPI002E15101D|nr:class I SAM-dependent methyltransferase [Dactylosporangium sp. NBC_01737]